MDNNNPKTLLQTSIRNRVTNPSFERALIKIMIGITLLELVQIGMLRISLPATVGGISVPKIHGNYCGELKTIITQKVFC